MPILGRLSEVLHTTQRSGIATGDRTDTFQRWLCVAEIGNREDGVCVHGIIASISPDIYGHGAAFKKIADNELIEECCGITKCLLMALLDIYFYFSRRTIQLVCAFGRVPGRCG